MADRSEKEVNLSINVDSWATDIEAGHSHQTPFNRSLFKHVAPIDTYE